MLNNKIEEVPVIEPETKPEETPEKPNEQPIKIPNPFIIPKPNIQPGTEPIPKA